MLIRVLISSCSNFSCIDIVDDLWLSGILKHATDLEELEREVGFSGLLLLGSDGLLLLQEQLLLFSQFWLSFGLLSHVYALGVLMRRRLGRSGVGNQRIWKIWQDSMKIAIFATGMLAAHEPGPARLREVHPHAA